MMLMIKMGSREIVAKKNGLLLTNGSDRSATDRSALSPKRRGYANAIASQDFTDASRCKLLLGNSSSSVTKNPGTLPPIPTFA
jgi:hypothetical protein